MRLDAATRAALMGEIREAVRVALEATEERWLTGEELRKHIGMFSPSWLKTYGSSLPRTQAVVTDCDGREHRTGWVYPLHRIERMLVDGDIKRLNVNV